MGKEQALTANCQYQAQGILSPSVPALDQAPGAPHQGSTLGLFSVP